MYSLHNYKKFGYRWNRQQKWRLIYLTLYIGVKKQDSLNIQII